MARALVSKKLWDVLPTGCDTKHLWEVATYLSGSTRADPGLETTPVSLKGTRGVKKDVTDFYYRDLVPGLPWVLDPEAKLRVPSDRRDQDVKVWLKALSGLMLVWVEKMLLQSVTDRRLDPYRGGPEAAPTK